MAEYRVEEYEVAVVGGGIAGLVTAVRAAELGLKTVLLEKGEDERYPCNARFSGGLLHAAFHDVQRSPAELTEIMEKSTQGTADPALVATIAEDGRRLLSWLREHDIRFMRFSGKEAHRWGMAPPRPVGPGLEWRGRGPDVMLRTLLERFRAAGGSVMLGVHASRLIIDGSSCRGIRGTRQNEPVDIPARAVVFSDGGFQSNLDLLREHVCSHPEALLQRGAANGSGDGVLMAMSAGGATRNMDKFYGHLHSRDALTNNDVWPYPELDGMAGNCIIVTPDGHRVIDEGLGGMAITNGLARLDDPNSATIICDAAIWDGPGRSARIPANPFLEKFGGTVLRADTVRELAVAASIDPDGLNATVTAYNAAMDSGDRESLSPPRSEKKAKAWKIAHPPFIAIPVCVAITYTMGGIAINGDGRIIDGKGMPIPGLYAAGTTTAGLEGGGDLVGYVGGLIKSVFGLRAAEHIAAEMRSGQA